MRRMALLGIACILASALTLTGGHRVQAQDTQSEEVRHYRAKTIALFKELMQLKREGVLVFSVFEGVSGPSFGADNPRAYHWLQRVRKHLAQAPRGLSCWEADHDFALFLSVCDSELLAFVGAGADEFNALAIRLWLLTLCTEHPHVCSSYEE